MQIHNEDFMFACVIPGCNMKFSQKSLLQYHILKHNEEKFFCDFPGCNKSFLTLKHLKQHQNTTVCQQKQAVSSHKSSDDFDCFLNRFEDMPLERSTKSSFDEEDFSPETEKFLHTEGERATCLETSNRACKSLENSTIDFKDFVQLMICKYLLDENRQIKAELAISTGPKKEKYENQMRAMLKKALNFRFDVNSNLL